MPVARLCRLLVNVAAHLATGRLWRGYASLRLKDRLAWCNRIASACHVRHGTHTHTVFVPALHSALKFLVHTWSSSQAPGPTPPPPPLAPSLASGRNPWDYLLPPSCCGASVHTGFGGNRRGFDSGACALTFNVDFPTTIIVAQSVDGASSLCSCDHLPPCTLHTTNVTGSQFLI